MTPPVWDPVSLPPGGQPVLPNIAVVYAGSRWNWYYVQSTVLQRARVLVGAVVDKMGIRLENAQASKDMPRESCTVFIVTVSREPGNRLSL